LILFGNRLRRM